MRPPNYRASAFNLINTMTPLLNGRIKSGQGEFRFLFRLQLKQKPLLLIFQNALPISNRLINGSLQPRRIGGGN